MSTRFSPRGLAVLAIAALAALSAQPVRAESKLGYVDYGKILSGYKPWEDAQRAFDQQLKSWDAEIDVLAGELDSLMTEYRSQELMLTDSMKKDKQDVIRAKKGAYEEFVRAIRDPEGGRVAQKRADLSKPILDKINGVIARIATDEKFTMVFESSNEGGFIVLYGAPGTDLTDRVLTELNKGAQ